MTPASPLVPFVAALALCPLLSGAARRLAAAVAGRRGASLFGGYRDLARLAKSNGVAERDVAWPAKAGPVAVFAGTLAGGVVIPMGVGRALFFFPGDFLFALGAFALAHACLVLAAMHSDTDAAARAAGREAVHGALALPIALLALAGMARATGQIGLSGIVAARSLASPDPFVPFLCAGAAMVLLAVADKTRDWADGEAARAKPSLERVVTEAGRKGADWTLVRYAADLRFWLMAALAVGFAAPAPSGHGLGLFLAGMAVFAVLAGVGEGLLAGRLRLGARPLLAGALVLALASIVTAGGSAA